jgi:hypothetical protein
MVDRQKQQPERHERPQLPADIRVVNSVERLPTEKKKSAPATIVATIV